MEERHSQVLEDIRIDVHLINEDGKDATGEAANLSTIIKDPDGNELIGGTDYVEATFNEIGTSGTFECLFLQTDADAFVSVDDNNTYTLVLKSSTTGVGQTSRQVAIRSVTQADMTRVLGLVMENLVEEVTSRDSNGNKTVSTIYIYDSAANATMHDKATGLVASYNITAGYTNNLMDLFKSIKAS